MVGARGSIYVGPYTPNDATDRNQCASRPKYRSHSANASAQRTHDDELVDEQNLDSPVFEIEYAA